MTIDDFRSRQLRLPAYVLAAEPVSERWWGGIGWDMHQIIHKRLGAAEEVRVGAIRRRLGRQELPTPPEIAKRDFAFELAAEVESSPNAIYEVGLELAASQTWDETDLQVDDKHVSALTCVYRDAWVVGHIGPDALIWISGHSGWRPRPVRIQAVDPDTIGAYRD